MKITLCTLFEGNYHYGVAALANSLIAAGYAGDLWVGYRGPLPSWITEAPTYDAASGQFQAHPTLRLRFVKLDTPIHFTYYKPTFLKDLLEQYEPEVDVVGYLDPDIVVKCPWEALSGWFIDGIALSEDVNFCFPARHPKRLLWARYFSPHGIAPVRELDRYYNAGFIGVPRQNIAFLDLWRRVCDLVIAHNGAKLIKAGAGGAALFHSTDQDGMNFALTASNDVLNTVGPEGMDFAPGGYYLSHAIGPTKPWHGRHIRAALRGVPPTAAAKWYYRYANQPIRVYSDSALAKRQLALKIAAAIGRLYKRA